MKSDIKLIQEDGLKVVAELRAGGYVNFIKEEERTSVVTISYENLEFVLSEIKAGTIGVKDIRRGIEAEFLKDGVNLIRPTNHVTLSRNHIELVYNEIRKSEGMLEEDNKQDEFEIAKLEAQKEILKEQIRLMHAKERELEEKIEEHQQSIERRKYKGKTFHEYFESVAGHYEEDGFKIQVGSAWDRTIYVTGMNGDFELNINTRYDDKKGWSLKVSKDTGVRDYYKEYFGHEIPKNHKKIYDEMTAIKNKYGKMIEDGTLEPKEALN
ncbi:hypothetical protein CN553_12175 [Bacillus cereus]|uniref:Uncharacterized protein n=1 Tax=Bacillus cereus TaxID=1396 RepID=A0A9X6YMH5_BACCE|nr:hypothetical protein [Bacillus cereus]PEN97801.1 hypothetical protein CN553_12175 [Bacillus cereus]